MARWETGAGNRPDDRPIKVVLLAWMVLAPSPDLILLASPLCPMASSIRGKASPAPPLSQLGAPAGTYVLKFWHLLQQLAGLHIIHDQGNYFGAEEVAWKVPATADPETIPNAPAELVRFWSIPWPQLTLQERLSIPRGCKTTSD